MTIDLGAAPTIPTDLILTQHLLGGLWSWNPREIAVWFARGQELGTVLDSTEMLHSIGAKRPLNANLLDWLLGNLQLVPPQWKGKEILFWGTQFRTLRHHRRVRTLDLRGTRPVPGLHAFEWGFDNLHPAVVWK